MKTKNSATKHSSDNDKSNMVLKRKGKSINISKLKSKGRNKNVNGSLTEADSSPNSSSKSSPRKQGNYLTLEKSPMVFRPKIKKELVNGEEEKKIARRLADSPVKKAQRRAYKKRNSSSTTKSDSSLSNLDEGPSKKSSKKASIDFESTEKVIQIDSQVEAKRSFAWLIYPVKPENFFKDVWEKKPLLVKRHHNTTYYKGLFSTQELDSILRDNVLQFGKNIDVTTYVNGKRETHNPDGRAHASVVWDYYQTGCSVRVLNPQTFSKSVWLLNSVLQEFFGSCVGSNIYLTPPGTQGFAPHYDDIEAFVLQLEGKKRWKIYGPRSPEETLPRYSSHNLNPSDLGENILNVELEPGDLLYFPRGFIHQASTSGDTHSLHITISAAQRNTWGDYLEKLLPRALEVMFEDDVEFRQSLPIDYMQYMGVAHSDVPNEKRDAFMKTLTSLMGKMIAQLPVDACADQMAKHYVHDCLPPVVHKGEKPLTIYAKAAKWDNGKIANKVALENNTNIRLFRANILRLVTEDNAIRVYHSMENSREYHGEELQYIEIAPEMALGVEFLLHSYPQFVTVNDIPVEGTEDKLTLATALYERGLLMTRESLTSGGGDETAI